MSGRSPIGSTLRPAAIAAGLAVGGYALYAGAAWYRYGRPTHGGSGEQDELLDRFMPLYDVVERHRIRVAAPAAITFVAATEQDLQQSPWVRAIFRTREAVLGATQDDRFESRGLLAAVQSLGWGILAEVPGREIIVGAVTKPWEANVTFRALPPDDFAAFAEPGYVKIAWTLRADPEGEGVSLFRTETRAIATDAVARDKFRRYWAFVSPGVAMIRRLSLGPLKRDAERRARVMSGVKAGAS